MLSNIAAAMVKRSYPTTVVSLLPNGIFGKRLRANGVEVIELDFTRLFGAIWGVFRLALVIRRVKPDVVQGWMYHGDLAALVGLVLSARRSRTLLVWGIRCSNMDLTQCGRILRMVIRACAFLSGLPDIVTANSEAGLDAHRRLGYRPRRSVVIDNGIDTTAFRPEPESRAAVRRESGIDDCATVLAMVARVDAMKHHSLFLAAMKDMTDLRAVLIGAGTEALAVPPNVRALGRRTDVARLLPACDFIVSSSAFGEGFSNAIAEGMACGLPAVSTDVGDARRIIGDTGIVVPPSDLAALTGGMRRLAEESSKQRAMRSDAARARIVDNFSLPLAVDRFIACYTAARSSPYVTT
jgi:glycosyltransferase involved in cell wall biosynthesis